MFLSPTRKQKNYCFSGVLHQQKLFNTQFFPSGENEGQGKSRKQLEIIA